MWSKVYGVFVIHYKFKVTGLPHGRCFYLFDSPAGMKKGEIIAKGKLVLLKFCSLVDIENYIQLAYL